LSAASLRCRLTLRLLLPLPLSLAQLHTAVLLVPLTALLHATTGSSALKGACNSALAFGLFSLALQALSLHALGFACRLASARAPPHGYLCCCSVWGLSPAHHLLIYVGLHQAAPRA
jgi:hypothetical protein